MADVAFGATPVQSDAQILASQVSSWRKEVARLEGLIAVATGSPSPDTVVIRREEVEALRKDAARLDFLEVGQHSLYVCSHQELHLSTDGSNRRDARFVFDGWVVGPTNNEPHPSIRSAIDAALTKEQGT